MGKYNLEQTKGGMEWDNFVLGSKNRNIYAMSDYISLENNVQFFYVKKNNEVIGAMPLKFNNNKIEKCNFLIQTPIIYRKLNNANSYRKNQEQLKIVDAVKNFLIKKFNSGYVTLDYHTYDIRPFLWSDTDFKITQKYTLLVDIKKYDHDIFASTSLFKDYSYTKKNETLRSEKQGYKFVENFSKKIFLQMTRDTLNHQGQEYNQNYYENTLNVLEKLYKKKLVTMFFVYNDNNLVTAAIISKINKFSTYLFSARSSVFQNTSYAGSFMIKNIFSYLKKENFETFDFEGMNSEKNSFYKMNYGGMLKTYYKLEFN